jgi:hypothetical protein
LNGKLGIIILGVVAVIVAVVFLQYMGKTTITGDADLPPLASPRR